MPSTTTANTQQENLHEVVIGSTTSSSKNQPYEHKEEDHY
jgi:hypothetical protein